MCVCHVVSDIYRLGGDESFFFFRRAHKFIPFFFLSFIEEEAAAAEREIYIYKERASEREGAQT